MVYLAGQSHEQVYELAGSASAARSAVVAVDAESNHGKRVKARRAEPGHSTAGAPC